MAKIHLIGSIHEEDYSDRERVLQFLSPTRTSSQLLKRYYRTYKDSSVEILSRDDLRLITQMGIDIKLTDLVSQIHRQQPLDCLFAEDFLRYELLLKYCNREKIKTEKTGLISIADKFQFVYFSIGNSENLANIVYQDEIQQLRNLYYQGGFSVFLVSPHSNF